MADEVTGSNSLLATPAKSIGRPNGQMLENGILRRPSSSMIEADQRAISGSGRI
jgi:hypothetical protein